MRDPLPPAGIAVIVYRRSERRQIRGGIVCAGRPLRVVVEDGVSIDWMAVEVWPLDLIRTGRLVGFGFSVVGVSAVPRSQCKRKVRFTPFHRVKLIKYRNS